MRVTLNGAPVETSAGTLFELRDELMPGRDVAVLNGFQAAADRPLSEGDCVHLGKKGELPSREELESLMSARHSPRVHGAVKGSVVGIAGLGGLGSNIAAALARLGVGRLVVADFDVVEPTNLNRQNYFVSHLGMAKTDATVEILRGVNPFVEVEAHAVRVSPGNAAEIFGGCDVVCEAFDSATEKAMLANALMEGLPGVPLVCGSGLAGYGDSNEIRTERRMGGLYLCGDGESAAGEGSGLMSPRVCICAGHMANAVLRILMGVE
ncbi:MAG: sulfur carrier protein ThiS adenylyltransferase ThiF [Candidatus Methanoplasma sp.]|jgi:sulfur carrier protein ThiS adenylyltransferase|nr:sulfur carrier protein ThiS adenylyltransferase ThiF [Candidatus Methanoplasma sp.]